jgi:hypothetical protein
MAFGKQKNSNQQYNLAYYKKKRNIFLFFAFLPLIFMIGMWFLLGVILDLRLDILLSIYLPFIIGYTFYLYFLRDKITYFTMYYEYYYMMENQIGPLKTHGALFTPSWLDAFGKDGFTRLANTEDFVIYQQFHHKLKDVANSGYTMVNIVVAKHIDVDFYDPKIDTIIQEAFEGYKYRQRVKKSITIQFKRYPELTEQVKDEIMQVINFKHYQQHIVNITAGYFHDVKKVYFLCPKHRFPNRYYYYACKQIMKYSKIREEDIDAKRAK